MDLWLFGYGSLMWKQGFSFLEKAEAYIEGYARRFWQGSTDHRGVPEAPGRVATLIPDPAARCYGLAFRVPDSGQEEVMEQLDYREKGGYRRIRIPLRFLDGRPSVEAIVYYAAEGNPNYLGPAPLPAIALQAHMAVGPSGANREYVLNVAATLRAHGMEDEHVFELARHLEDL